MNEELELVLKHIEGAKKYGVNFTYSHKIMSPNVKYLKNEGYKVKRIPLATRMAGRFNYYKISW